MNRGDCRCVEATDEGEEEVEGGEQVAEVQNSHMAVNRPDRYPEDNRRHTHSVHVDEFAVGTAGGVDRDLVGDFLLLGGLDGQVGQNGSLGRFYLESIGVTF